MTTAVYVLVWSLHYVPLEALMAMAYIYRCILPSLHRINQLIFNYFALLLYVYYKTPNKSYSYEPGVLTDALSNTLIHPITKYTHHSFVRLFPCPQNPEAYRRYDHLI